MKKQYLISLLILVAISVSFESNFSFNVSSTNNSTNSNFNNEELNTPIEEYSTSDEYFDWTIEQISMGSKSSAAVVNDGTEDGDHLYTWGANDHGQLGVGDNRNHNTPQEVTELPEGNIEQISMGYDHSGAIVDGSLYLWGNNDHFQLGTGENNEDYTTPLLLPDNKDFVNGNIEQIFMGNSFSMAVVNEDNEMDSLYTWGANDFGQLGLGNTKDAETPKKVQKLPEGDIKQITGSKYDPLQGSDEGGTNGNSFAGAVVNDESGDHLYTWGNNYYGKLGLGGEGECDQGQDSSFNTPQEVTDLSDGNIEQISMGFENSGAIVDNKLYTWGINDHDQLGQEGAYSSNTPLLVKELPSGDIEQISMGENVSSAIVAGQLYTWGEAQYGQLGIETENDQSTPQLISIPKEGNQEQVSMVSIGTNHSAAVENNELYTWGTNDKGQLGLGNTTTYSLPELVDSNFPYLINVSSNTEQIDDETNNILIKFGFETNVDVKSVDVNVFSDENNDIKYYDSWIPPSNDNEVYNGEIAFKLDPSYSPYSYSIDLNYLPRGADVTEIKTIEQISTGKIEIEKEVNEPTISAFGGVNVTSPTEAEVTYLIEPSSEEWTDENGNPIILVEVKWMDGDDELASSEKKEDTLYAKDLKPTQEYNTKLVAEFEREDSSLYTTESDNLNFTMDGVDDLTTVKQVGKVRVKSPTTASVKYRVNLGKTPEGDPVTLNSVDWIVDGTSVASSTKTTDVLTYDGFSPSSTYTGTTIEVKLSCGEVSPIEVETFEMQDGTTSSVISENEKVEVTSSTEANVCYKVEPGTDEEGIPVTITKVVWKNKKETLATDTINEGTGIDGKLETDKLNPNQKYNGTTIQATMSDGSKTNIVELEEFKTNFYNNSSTLDICSVEVTSPTEANVSYTVNLETGESGENLTIKKVSWMDGVNELASSEEESGTLKTNELTEDTEYNNTIIIVEFNEDGYENLAGDVDYFETPPIESETIPPTMAVTNGEITETSITINYVSTLGQDIYGKEYKLTKIEVQDSLTNSMYYSDEDNDGLDESGKIFIDGLISGTPYNDLVVISTFKDSQGNNYEPLIETSIDDFTTLGVDEGDETIPPTMAVTNGEITETSITINYFATLGQDDYEEEYKLAKIEVKDSNEQSIYSKSSSNGLEDSGEIFINNLNPGTTYDDLVVISTFEDSKGDDYEPPIRTNVDSFTTLDSGSSEDENRFQMWMIVTAGLIILLFILIIFGGIIYLFNKYKSIKI